MKGEKIKGTKTNGFLTLHLSFSTPFYKFKFTVETILDWRWRDTETLEEHKHRSIVFRQVNLY